MSVRILIVEDDLDYMAKVMQTRISAIRSRFPDAIIQLSPTWREGLALVREIPKPDCVFLDLGLPDSEWRETLLNIDQFESHSPTIIVSGHSEETIRKFLSNPHIEIIHKDETMWNKLLGAILRAMQRGGDPLAENIQRMKELLDAPAQ